MAYAFEKFEALNEVMQLAASSPLNCTLERWSHLVSAVNEEIYWLVSDKSQAREEAGKAARELVAQEIMYLDKLAHLRGVLDRVRKEVLVHVEGRDDVCEVKLRRCRRAKRALHLFRWGAAKMIAALYVERDGAYYGLPDVDPWDEARDARLYDGPWPVVAHPPCQRWGRYWHGAPRKPHQYKLGDDGGCFESALAAVRKWGGVLEHPAHSHAWARFGLNSPPKSGGWVVADFDGGWTCHVEQGHYGHFSRKPTWLYAAHVHLPQLRWGAGEQRIPDWMIERYGYEKARRIGVMAMVGGKDKTRIRNTTPDEFRDVLIWMALSAVQDDNSDDMGEFPLFVAKGAAL